MSSYLLVMGIMSLALFGVAFWVVAGLRHPDQPASPRLVLFGTRELLEVIGVDRVVCSVKGDDAPNLAIDDRTNQTADLAELERLVDQANLVRGEMVALVADLTRLGAALDFAEFEKRLVAVLGRIHEATGSLHCWFQGSGDVQVEARVTAANRVCLAVGGRNHGLEEFKPRSVLAERADAQQTRVE